MVDYFKKIFKTEEESIHICGDFYLTIHNFQQTIVFHKLMPDGLGIILFRRCTKLRLNKIKELMELLNDPNF